jgi:hypothetical protein
MVKTSRCIGPPWSDISVGQWDLLWSGEITLKKYGETLWTVGHKVVDLYHSLSKVEVPRLMLLGENCRQTYTEKVTHTPHLPEETRKLLKSYLRLADWNQLHHMAEGSPKIFNWVTSPEIVE